MLRPLAGISATREALRWRRGARARSSCWRGPSKMRAWAVLAFLADGESWSSSALALALGASQRTVQRALDSLAAAGKVQSFGRGRARRWMTPPVPGFTTILLLPAPLPAD
jgi:predicted ArsR family transcriptional regulator